MCPVKIPASKMKSTSDSLSRVRGDDLTTGTPDELE